MTDENNDLKKLLNAAPAPAPDDAKMRRAADAVWHKLTHPKPRRSIFAFGGGSIVPASVVIIAVLFGGLSYAVTQSTRSGAGDTASETNLISSAQLTQYPAGIRTSVVRMLISGLKHDELLFDSPDRFSNLNENDHVRAVFHPQGGNATFQLAPGDVVTATTDPHALGTWFFNANTQIENIGNTTATDGTGNDYAAFLPHLSTGICRRLNEEVGLDPIIPTINIDPAIFMTTQDRSHPFINKPGPIIGGALTGQPFGCFTAIPANINIYYHVLIER